jgi:hypothetical protein
MLFIKLTEPNGNYLMVQVDKIETVRPYTASYEGSKINFRQDDAPLYVLETPADIMNTIQGALIGEDYDEQEKQSVHGSKPVAAEG